MAVLYLYKGEYRKVEPLLLENYQMCQRLYKTDHPDLAEVMNTMAYFYGTIGNYQKAQPYYIGALEMYRQIYKSDHPNLATSINNLAYFYQEIANYQKAEQLYIEALEMRKRLYKTDHPDLAQSINNLAYFYNAVGNDKEAEYFFIEAYEMTRRIFKTDHPDFAQSTLSMAKTYHSRGELEKAEPLYLEALEMYKRIYKTDHPDIAQSIRSLARLYKSIGDYEKAKLLFIEALEMTRRLYKTDHRLLATTINSMAAYYNSIGEFEKAEPLLIEALEMRRRIFKKDHPEIANGINNMAFFYFSTGDNNQAEPLYLEALEMRRRMYNKNHPDLASSINVLANFYYATGDYDKTETLYIEALNMYSAILNNYFPSLSENEKEKLWNNYRNNFERFNAFIIKRVENNPKIIINMFNNQQNTKAILLNSTKKVRNRIMNSGDSVLIEKYDDWRVVRNQIAKYQKLSKTELERKGFDLDSLLNEANEREKELSKLSEDFAKVYEKKQNNWQNVRNTLDDNEAAIEFIRFRKFGKVANKYNPEVIIDGFTDTVYYAALIVSKETKEHPELVLLDNGNQLEGKYIELYRDQVKKQRKLIYDHDKVNKTLRTLYNQYWQKIQEKLNGIKTVYLSLDGAYNQINLNTIINPKTGNYLLEEMDIRIITSTRDLIERKMDTTPRVDKNNSAVLFGDPQFSLDSVKYVELASRFVPDRSRDYYYLGNTIDSLTRVGIQSLPGTRVEVEKISEDLIKNNWEVQEYLGSEALEEALKSVNNPRVLHIATHGKFLKNVEVSGERSFGMSTERYVENPLLRSFLLFAGSEETLDNPNKYMPDREDGVLTAYEAMNLDLDNTELVVLSACNTGLGEVRNGEGVYGLQRAFQVAGAKTLIMSLWTVSDLATQELMVSFYKKWLSGKTKREAFREAQMDLKKKYPGFYYWGAFVMVGE